MIDTRYEFLKKNQANLQSVKKKCKKNKKSCIRMRNRHQTISTSEDV